MYDREYEGKKLNFEASGGLLHSSLVMQDQQTDSYWAIMAGQAIAGRLKDTELKELPGAQKIQWKDWLKKHPDTLVLSVDGREDIPVNVYEDYFRSGRGFRGAVAADERLETRTPIFAFRLADRNYAVPHKRIEGGATFDLGDRQIFLYRPKNAGLFASTLAFKTNGRGFTHANGKWTAMDSGCMFDPAEGTFEGKNDCPKSLPGFDTFWYNWSLSNPATRILE